MISSDDLQTIINGAQAAALDDSLWQSWAEGIIRKVGSTGGIIGLVDQTNKVIERPQSFFEDVRGFEEYVSEMIAFDPQIVKNLNAKGTGVYTDDEHVDLSNPHVREYMKWQADRLNFHTHITLHAQADPTHMAAISIHFPKEHAERAKQLKAAYLQMLPDVSNAMRLGFSMSHILTQAYWDGSQALLDGRAAFLLCEYGRVLFLNQAAENIVRDGSLLNLKGRRLSCTFPAQNARLQNMIRAGILHNAPRGSVMQLGQPHDDSLQIAEIFPVNRARRLMAVSEPAALLVITRPGQSSPMIEHRLKEALGLTETEARVAVYLTSGTGDNAIALAMGIAVSTVRTHVRSILAKAHVHSKSELAHLLTMIVR
ncbi:MAG: helix-turn-helix transcriptional regulator [Sphingobium sp.]|jgi:DNA-binding CsgD family transcriptional regulator|nr:helix-turn-helix transcriptional regulator [Sphingobium sp.]MCI1271873.1 helix-turn-helix transcriptional regulator [Sphingobium sp.]MCI1756426.1 helix-turn-helix transcriptional regulator [Sphingobium sp.]MCI2051877.1 helix-turn-helix transcriptional regulator [Sphingobium sp.]